VPRFLQAEHDQFWVKILRILCEYIQQQLPFGRQPQSRIVGLTQGGFKTIVKTQ
jgi:hypothetical protein